MAYNPNPSSVSLHFPITGAVLEWQIAENGKWFIGVVDTSKGAVFLVPVNPFETNGRLNQDALNNRDPRAINRYASGVPADRTGAPQHFLAFFGGDGNWLEQRPAGMTHHTAVALHYGSDPSDCLGFGMVKTEVGFGKMSCASTSLNGDKEGTWIAHSFSRATAANRQGFFPGSFQMPVPWRDAVAEFLRTGPLQLPHLAVSHD